MNCLGNLIGYRIRPGQMSAPLATQPDTRNFARPLLVKHHREPSGRMSLALDQEPEALLACGTAAQVSKKAFKFQLWHPDAAADPNCLHFSLLNEKLCFASLHFKHLSDFLERQVILHSKPETNIQ